MDYHFRKQLIIILIILFVLGLIGTGVYFKYYWVGPTCFDGKQNQDEEGVDCGGLCVSCERLTIQEIQTLWTKFVILGVSRYDLVAKISNPNPNFGLERFDYVFKIYDLSGGLLTERGGRSFISPNQQKYLLANNVTIGGEIGKVELEIEKVPREIWEQLADDYALPSVYVREKQFGYLDDQPGVSRASGLIKNDSAFDFDRISVTVILFNQAKEIIGTNYTEARTVLSGEDRYFSTLWFSPIQGQVGSVEMMVEANLLLDENFMRKYGMPEKFQEYLPTIKP